MNQKELNEIKKTMIPERNCIMKIAGCYVDTEKNIKTTINQTFLMLTEEEQFKYFELFKKGLSGKIGKNQINLDFPIKEEKEGGCQAELMKILDSGLDNEEILNALYEKVISLFSYPDNYYILIGYGIYDIPGRTSDGNFVGDASEDVYKFLSCQICPIKPSKAGLSYDAKENTIVNALRNMMVEHPIHGFLFPAFNDRNTDIHSVLYYTKKPEGVSDEIVEYILGCNSPATAKNQSDIFINAIEKSTENLNFEQAKNVCENLKEMEFRCGDSEVPVVLDKKQSCKILEDSGISLECIETFEQIYESEVKEQGEVLLGNVFGGSDKMEIKAGNAKIVMPVEDAYYITVQKVDGNNCLVIKVVGDLTVNGMNINQINTCKQ